MQREEKRRLTRDLFSRTPRPTVEGTKGQGRGSVRNDKPVNGRGGQQPQAPGQPAQRRLRYDRTARVGRGAGAAQEGGAQCLRRESGEQSHSPHAHAQPGRADSGHSPKVCRQEVRLERGSFEKTGRFGRDLISYVCAWIGQTYGSCLGPQTDSGGVVKQAFWGLLRKEFRLIMGTVLYDARLQKSEPVQDVAV